MVSATEARGDMVCIYRFDPGAAPWTWERPKNLVPLGEAPAGSPNHPNSSRGYAVRDGASTSTAAPPAHRRRPPPPGTKERKGTTSSGATWSILDRILFKGSKVMAELTEVADLVEVFFEALPEHIQEQAKKEWRSMNPDSRGGMAMKAWAVYKYADHLDLSKIVTGYIYNHYEDKVIGTLNRRAEENSPRLLDRDNIMRGRGLTLGPAV